MFEPEQLIVITFDNIPLLYPFISSKELYGPINYENTELLSVTFALIVADINKLDASPIILIYS